MSYQAMGENKATAAQAAANKAAEGKPVSKRMENRRNNLRALIKKHDGPKAFAELTGMGQSWLSQMCGPHPTRPVSEDTARSIEEKLALPVGSLDFVSIDQPPAVTAPRAADAIRTMPTATSSEAARDADIVRLLAAVWSADAITMPVLKFGQIAAYAISEAAETGKVPTEASLRRLIALLK